MEAKLFLSAKREVQRLLQMHAFVAAVVENAWILSPNRVRQTDMKSRLSLELIVMLKA